MELETCPQEVIDRADVLYFNGFSGFQGPPNGGKDRFVLCWPLIDVWEGNHLMVTRLSEACGVRTLRLNDWLGRDYLSVHWSEYHKRFDVLSAMLRAGHAFQTQTKGMPSFRPDADGVVFTQDLLERRVMEQSRELLKYGLLDMIDNGRCEEWNWSSDEGRAFARMLRQTKGLKYDETRENFYHWPLFQQYDPATLRNAAPVAPVDEPEMCMCCLDRLADTMVLPCEHAVVCRDCSLQLESTSNSWLCIKCRQPIAHKLL